MKTPMYFIELLQGYNYDSVRQYDLIHQICQSVPICGRVMVHVYCGLAEL